MPKILKEVISSKGLQLRTTLMAVQSAADIAELVEGWDGLAARTPGHSLSQTAEFAGIALEMAARSGKECFIITVRDAEKLVGIWGLVRRKAWIHSVLEPFSCGLHEEMSSPLLEAQYADEAAKELVRLTLSIRADRICFYNLPRQGAIDRAVGQLRCLQRMDFVQSYLLDREIFPNWDAVEAQLSKSFKGQLKRYEQKLSERGAVEFGWSQTAEDANEVLDFIYETKRAWLGRKRLKSDWLAKEDVREFFRTLFQRPSFGQAPIISWIKLNGKPIAGGVLITTGDLVEGLITTFDPSFSDVSCGNILTKYEITLSLATGRSYDIGLIAAGYKERWAATPRFFTTRVVMLSPWGAIPSFVELLHILRRCRTILTGFLSPVTGLPAAHGHKPRMPVVVKSPAAQNSRHAKSAPCHLPSNLLHQSSELGRRLLGRRQAQHPIDLKYGIETTQRLSRRAIAPGTLLDRQNVGYARAQPSILRKCLDLLPIGDDAAFIDIGSGKGRMLAVAAEYPFSKIIGIELSPVVFALARANVRALAKTMANGPKIRLIEGGATQFPDPGCETIVLFLYNPSYEALVERFLAHLEQGIGKKAKVFVIYYNPVHHEVFDRSAMFSRMFAARMRFDDAEMAALAFGNSADSVLIYQNAREPIQQPFPGADAGIKISIPNFGAGVLP